MATSIIKDNFKHEIDSLKRNLVNQERAIPSERIADETNNRVNGSK